MDPAIRMARHIATSAKAPREGRSALLHTAARQPKHPCPGLGVESRLGFEFDRIKLFPDLVAEAASAALHESPGRPLDAVTRYRFERRFGRRFDDVRIHTDGSANAMAEALGARAFTVGNHIAVREGLHAPRSDAWQRLLAHELTHVLQQ